jgi:hypothetical protein
MSNRSRNAAVLGAEKPQSLDRFMVSDDAGNGFSAGSVGRLALGTRLGHGSGHELAEFGRNRDRAGAQVIGRFAGLSRRKATILASLGRKGAFSVVVHGGGVIQEPSAYSGRIALATRQAVVECGNLSRRHLLDHFVLPVEPIPTMGESYGVTSYNATTVRRVFLNN